MKTFVDTSGLYALLDRDDAFHTRASEWLVSTGFQGLHTHSYVVVEMVALVQRRLGTEAVSYLVDDLLPPIELTVVDEHLHLLSNAQFMSSLDRKLSYVDRVSFQFMRREKISRAFSFDRHFETEGFELVC